MERWHDPHEEAKPEYVLPFHRVYVPYKWTKSLMDALLPYMELSTGSGSEIVWNEKDGLTIKAGTHHIASSAPLFVNNSGLSKIR